MTKFLAFTMTLCASTIVQGKAMAHNPIPEHGRQRDDLVELYKFSGWYQPRKELKTYHGQSRLLLRLEKGGKATLNPDNEGLAGTQVINLKGLSKKDAQILWGDGRKTLTGITVDLIADFRAEIDVYHLDMKFSNNILTSYRIRGIGISDPQWTEVK